MSNTSVIPAKAGNHRLSKISFVKKTLLSLVWILFVAFALTKLSDVLVRYRVYENYCNKETKIGNTIVSTGINCPKRYWSGFPIRSQFCGTLAEKGCIDDDVNRPWLPACGDAAALSSPSDSCRTAARDMREPIYIFGTPYNDWTRFQLNYLFWIIVTGIFWLPGKKLIKFVLKKRK